MVSIVEITQASDVVTCNENGQATISFTVSNKNISPPRQRRVGFRINVEGEAKRTWFEIEGKRETTLEIDETEVVAVKIKVADGNPDVIYKFSLLVFDVTNMDEDYTQSKTIAVKVPAKQEMPAQPEPKSKKWLIWLIVGVVVVVLVAVIAFLTLGKSKNKAPQINPQPPIVEERKDPPKEEPASVACPYGTNQCLSGYVWREAFPGDYVCVTPETRTQAAYDNSQVNDRRDPKCASGDCTYGVNQCLPGYVWRDAYPGDYVCVSGETRTQAALDNREANTRRDPSCSGGAVPKVSFSIGRSAHTNLNDDGGGNSAFLDRHAPDCGNDAISQFNLHRGSEMQYQYKYTCTTGGSLQPPKTKHTNPDLNGGGNLIYLDRQNVDCGVNSVLTKFQLLEGWNSGGQFSNDKMRYNYSCAISNQPLSCREVATTFNDEGGGNAIFLDRHDVKCAANEAISQFRLVRSGRGTFQYQYKCCS